MATVIHPDGHEETLLGYGPRGILTLEQMQKAVGGYIEHVPWTGREIVFVNDGSFKADELLPNLSASERFQRPLRGPVIVCDAEEVI